MNQFKVPAIPAAIQAERGVTSVALNHPSEFMQASTESGFDIRMISNELCRSVLSTLINQSIINGSTDSRVIFEKTILVYRDLKFHELTELWCECPIIAALPEMLSIIRDVYNRKRILSVSLSAIEAMGNPAVPTGEIIGGLLMSTDEINSSLAPSKTSDTKQLLMQAITRYENGDDKSMRLSTGFEKLDNITPIRFGDFLVIGGPEKSGKSMLATNIIANLIKNEKETNQPNPV